jgi:hypothetical protein
MTTFDDYIRCKGIKADVVYRPAEAAKLIGVNPFTVEKYMWVGRKTPRCGVVSLRYHVNVRGCEIIGADLIEFLRQTHREGGE